MNIKPDKVFDCLAGIGLVVAILLVCSGLYVIIFSKSPNQQTGEFTGQIQQSQRGDLIILTNGEIYAVVSVLDSNYVLCSFGREQWNRGSIQYFAERAHAVIAENSADAMRVKAAFYDQVVGRTSAPIRVHP